MTKPDDCAFPTNPVYGGPENDVKMEPFEAGLTIREHMATQIMAGFGMFTKDSARVIGALGKSLSLEPSDVLAGIAVERADALIKALNQPVGAAPT